MTGITVGAYQVFDVFKVLIGLFPILGTWLEHGAMGYHLPKSRYSYRGVSFGAEAVL